MAPINPAATKPTNPKPIGRTYSVSKVINTSSDATDIPFFEKDNKRQSVPIEKNGISSLKKPAVMMPILASLSERAARALLYDKLIGPPVEKMENH